MKIWSNVVVGAGISGLVLAQRIKNSGQEVLVLDKGKSVGGRMATRRDGDATFDHGAQFSSTKFSDFLDDQAWITWFSKNDSLKYAYRDGMNKAAKQMSQGLEIVLNQKVTNVNIDSDYVTLFLESKEIIFTKKVYLTCPVPQSCEVLKSSSIVYPEALDRINYAKALVGLFRIESDKSELENLTYVEDDGRGIFSVSNQKSKSISSGLAYTVVMNPKFSENYFESRDQDILFLVENCFASFLQAHCHVQENDYRIVRSQLKKWRYSHPLNVYESPFCSLAQGKIVLLGDGFTGASLQQAAKSALSIII